MAILSFDELFQRADASPQPVPIAVVGGADATVLQALRTACDRGWVRPLVAGSDIEMRQTAEANGVGLDGFTLVDSADPPTACVDLIQRGQARLLMKGQVATQVLMHAVLDPSTGLRTGRVICQVVHMELRTSARRFLLADTGICIQPTLDQKRDILQSAVELAHALGAETPRVAVLAATESVTASMPETLDAAELQKQAIPGCLVRGPLSFDMAFDPDAARKKKREDAEFGVADILLFPSLAAANLTVKAIMYTADCRFGGVLCGARCPVVFMSRADTTATRLHSLALALSLVRS
jgi:phosphotransacetylase